jgi:Mn-dependent DtxR family transcriptional regulator
VTQPRAAAQILADAGPTLSVQDTAAVLNVSPDLVRAMHRRGELAALGIRVLRLGRRVRITTASVRRAVDRDEPA